MRWGDMDAQGHINNAAYLDYLQEARVCYLLGGPPALQNLLATGVLVVSHQVEYLQPDRVPGTAAADRLVGRLRWGQQVRHRL